MTLRLSLLSPVLLLAACASQPAAQSSTGAAAATPAECHADAAQGYLGQPASAATVEAVRKASGAASLRVLKPGDAMTMDYRMDRVNVVQDAAGKIERISCG